MANAVVGEGPWYQTNGGSEMIAALNMGLVGTIIVIAIVVALVLFFLRRA